MPPPPPATTAAPGFLLGPALRTQSDGRLVALVREGYENAFEEIVRRYGRALGRYAAAIVPNHRAEDVTQDAFSKALLALRGTDNEIELRPWLYRIVRNTALNDLRDQPAAAAPLLDTEEAPVSVAEEIEHREELKDLMKRLGALPDSQRAAIVMRELEGLSHEEIAAALGISGGAARQAIHRARVGLRDGLGMLLPLPLLRWMLAGAPGAESDAAQTASGAIAGAAGGAGGGIAIKAAAATVLVAGSVGTGVAIHERDATRDVAVTSTVSKKAGSAVAGVPGTAGDASSASATESGSGSSGSDGQGGGSSGNDSPSGDSALDARRGGSGSSGPGDDSGSGGGHLGERSGDDSGHGGSSGPGGPGPGSGGPSPAGGGADDGRDRGPGGGSDSVDGGGGSQTSGGGPGPSGSGHGGDESPLLPPPVGGSGSGSSGSGGSGSGGSGSGDGIPPLPGT